jgi:hypothetical protein
MSIALRGKYLRAWQLSVHPPLPHVLAMISQLCPLP